MFLTCACDQFFFAKSLRRAPAWRSGALAHSFPLVFSFSQLSVVSCACGLTTSPSTLAQEKRSTFAVSFRNYTTRHYTTLHYNTRRDYTIQDNTYKTTQYSTIQHNTTQQIQFNTLQYITFLSTPCHFIPFHDMTVQYNTTHYVSLAARTIPFCLSRFHCANHFFFESEHKFHATEQSECESNSAPQSLLCSADRLVPSVGLPSLPLSVSLQCPGHPRHFHHHACLLVTRSTISPRQEHDPNRCPSYHSGPNISQDAARASGNDDLGDDVVMRDPLGVF